MTDHYNRKLRLVPASESLIEVMQLVPRLSDEEWERHDAEVRADYANHPSRRAEAEAEARRQARERERNPDRLDQLLELGFPRRAIEAVRAGVELREPAIGRIGAYRESAEIIVLSGPKGCGKTVAATWWAAQRREHIRFLRASMFAASSRYERETRDEWFSGPLVLDDLGAEFVDSKGSFLADLDELVDVFYSDLRPLVITTNCGADDFRQRYGERIADRLRECGRWISLNGDSLRRRPTGLRSP